MNSTDTYAVVTARPRSTAYTVLIGLTGLAVLLQGLWAGIFLQHDGARDDASAWIDVHARGGEVAIGLAVAAVVAVVVTARQRRDLLAGTVVLIVLMAVEAYLGGLVRDDGQDALTIVHVPLGMAIMVVTGWLAMRSRQR